MVATLKKQKKNTKDEFDERAKAIIVEFAQQVSPLITDHILLHYITTLLHFYVLAVKLKVNSLSYKSAELMPNLSFSSSFYSSFPSGSQRRPLL